MRGGSKAFLRAIPRKSSSTPQHTPPPLRISPSPSTSSSTHQSIFIQLNNNTSPVQFSRRALSSSLRSQRNHNIIRDALACEASSLRYALMLSSEGDEALLRGWDDGVANEDDDGTWVKQFCMIMIVSNCWMLAICIYHVVIIRLCTHVVKEYMYWLCYLFPIISVN